MLQFIVTPDDRYSMPELAQMAIEGGCKWVILRVGDMPDEAIRELCAEIVPLCKETSTILTIENHVELAKELGLHGVHLRNCPITAAQVREMFGPEAIIGVEVEKASDALPVAAADGDYVTFPLSMPIELVGDCVEALRNDKFELPIVAECGDNVADAMAAIALGANGVAVSDGISAAADPVERTAEYIRAISKP